MELRDALYPKPLINPMHLAATLQGMRVALGFSSGEGIFQSLGRETPMIAYICPVCRKSLNKGIWDKHTQRIYCSQCIPPLPQSERMASAVWTRPESGHKIDSK